jgi:putative two-component system response regulator
MILEAAPRPLPLAAPVETRSPLRAVPETRPRILIVDDDTAVRGLVRACLGPSRFESREAGNGHEVQRLVRQGFLPDLVLLDVNLPGLSGVDVLPWLQREVDLVQVIMISGNHELEIVRFCLREGAYDYLVKPFEVQELVQTVERGLERRRLVGQNRAYRDHLEDMVEEQTREIQLTRDIALLAMARLAESRDRQTGEHLERIAEYSRILTEALREGPYRDQVGGDFVEQVVKSSPLHDIGKVGIPDAILLKTGPLTPEEKRVVESHTTIGGDTLRSVVDGAGESFLAMAIDVADQHHERWDGSGYPRGLGGKEICLPARIVALVDAYDAITSDRPYKRAYDHAEAVERIAADRGRHFDPVLVDAFLACHDRFARVRAQLRGISSS